MSSSGSYSKRRQRGTTTSSHKPSKVLTLDKISMLTQKEMHEQITSASASASVMNSQADKEKKVINVFHSNFLELTHRDRSKKKITVASIKRFVELYGNSSGDFENLISHSSIKKRISEEHPNLIDSLTGLEEPTFFNWCLRMLRYNKNDFRKISYEVIKILSFVNNEQHPLVYVKGTLKFPSRGGKRKTKKYSKNRKTMKRSKKKI